MVKNVCIYAASSNSIPESFSQKSAELAEALALEGVDLVFGAGAIGIMRTVADIFIRHERKTIGVIPEKLNLPGIVHEKISKLFVVSNMRKRKELMENLAEAFIACPGGIGTVEELMEIFTLKQLGYHKKPIVIYNVDGFYDSLLQFLDHILEYKFMKKENMELVFVSDNIQEIIEYFRNYQPPEIVLKWI